MVSVIRVKSPFSQSALFGFMGVFTNVILSPDRPSSNNATQTSWFILLTLYFRVFLLRS
jgi:hypothetical protein